MNEVSTINNYTLPDGSIYSGECIKKFNYIELKGKGKFFILTEILL